jgi:hypothetical protein
MPGEQTLEAPPGYVRLYGSCGCHGETLLYRAGLTNPAELYDAPTLAIIGTRGITQMSDL